KKKPEAAAKVEAMPGEFICADRLTQSIIQLNYRLRRELNLICKPPNPPRRGTTANNKKQTSQVFKTCEVFLNSILKSKLFQISRRGGFEGFTPPHSVPPI